ncbi:Putative Mn2+ efflux pump MntP [Lachnospiraceae bacterium]|nr:Putative Mn2+ efflux pump MntP [Lachnospiraceae bacterium]
MFRFIINSILLGVGLAMDAFSVSIVNGINEPDMPAGRTCGIAGTYAGFQFAMPMIGWVCVHTILEYFEAFQKFIPWIALLLLLYIGGKMLIEGLSKKDDEEETETAALLSAGTLVVQGIATSIDALSVGFTIANYRAASAFSCSMLIAVTTFIICFVGLHFGKKLGERFADRATVLGGVILILIGIEIFVTGI